MPDKITVISLVWMTMVGAMLMAMVTLRNEEVGRPDNAKLTAISYPISQY